MSVQDGFKYGLGQISVSAGDQLEEITENKPVENLPAEQEEEPVEAVSGNEIEAGNGILQYVLVDAVEPLPASIDYTIQLTVVCLFLGIIAGCLLFLAFGRGLGHGC